MMLAVLLVLVITIIYYLIKRHYQYWKRRGVPGPEPTILVGNFAKALLFKESPGLIFAEIYNKFPNDDIVGVYRVTTPVILIRDPEVIKEVTVKSFNHFRDNDIDVNKKRDPLFGRSPFVLKGDEWKMVRAQLTPAFTSGKMKWIFPLIEDVCKNFVKFIEKTPEATNGQGCEAKELCARFTLNSVATCAFGLDGKCFEEENSYFRQLAKDFFTPGGWSAIAMFLITIFPPLSLFFSLKFTTDKVEKQLIDLVSRTLKYREENNVVRNDFLQVISQLKTTSKDYEFTDLDVTAHAAGFFGDGAESSSTVMSFVLFELARNPDAQNKLREEVNKAFVDNKGTAPYEVLQSLPYLEAVINESLRIHPSIFLLQKVCTKTFSFTAKNNTKLVTIEEGTPIVLPLYALHHDPQHHPDPECFKPERFTESEVPKYTFMPFGEGPRSCLGQRFGMLQIKAGVAYIIHNYELHVNKKTQLPIKYNPTHILAAAIGGLWLNFKKIV